MRELKREDRARTRARKAANKEVRVGVWVTVADIDHPVKVTAKHERTNAPTTWSVTDAPLVRKNGQSGRGPKMYYAKQMEVVSDSDDDGMDD